jgi:tRNA pseudouridine32 synthase/23S rRNA pseudouridine746 synthase
LQTPFHPLDTSLAPPERFTYPFRYVPHPLCLLAARQVQQQLATMTLTEGKMFGVLVVEGGRLGFVAAYSGLLEGRNDWPYFVPPVFDAQQPDGHFKTTERHISSMTAPDQHDERRRLSQELQQWLFRQYRVLNARGEERDLVELWHDYHSSPRLRQRFPLPPGGTGDCCAPKLLQYAYREGLRPLCMAEFWWEPPRPSLSALHLHPSTLDLGLSTLRQNGAVRHHGQFYPACRGKCLPVLTWMLQGLDVDGPPMEAGHTSLDIEVVYEDDSLVVVDKPAGLLSAPGRTQQHSVAAIAQQRWPGALLVHRLDQATSGLLVIAKQRDVYRQLQRQFAERSVEKRYVALLARPLPDGKPRRGTISLPLYGDPTDRPYQVVDHQLGKPAVTDYEMLGDRLVALTPHTGRTHQLRVHCAHRQGLDDPIAGDELYGLPSGAAADVGRLCLHAERLAFLHPVSQRRLAFCLPAPFSEVSR